MVNAFRIWARECWPAWGVGGILAIVTVFIAGPAIVPLVVPMSSVYELRSVTVKDAMVGTPPKIIVDRTIKEDFRGRFEIEIMRAEGSEFSAFWACGPHASDWRMYRSNAAIPDNANLDWWLEIPPNGICRLPPGSYKIVTTVSAKGPLGAELSTTTASNVFNVFLPGQAPATQRQVEKRVQEAVTP